MNPENPINDHQADAAPGDHSEARSAAPIEACSDEPETVFSDPAAEILTLQAALQQKQDEFLRAKAETENVRRRGVEERIKAQKFAIENFASDLLPVLDVFASALANPDAPLDKVLEGVAMTQKLLTTTLEKNAVKMIVSTGAKFDPALHQAIAMEPSDGEAGMVLKVMQEGYALQDRVLRPAMVVVSQAK